jgi:hypothetical protein
MAISVRFQEAQLRGRLWALVAAALVSIAASCSAPGHDGGGDALRTMDGVPIVTPTSAYGRFPYEDPAQHAAFRAFVACAADYGLDYEGPFADSSGEGVFLRLAAGESASRNERQTVDAECPQATVGIFGTRVGPVREHAFERAATAFARCLRSRDDPAFPIPDFTSGDPLDAFWRLPFDWQSRRFTESVRACDDPLRSYLFPG